MEKEVTALDYWSMILDGIYKIIMFVVCITMANNIVNDKGIILLIVLSIFAFTIKTVVGLFNFSPLVDFLQYYIDLGVALLMGRSFGIIVQGYFADFYNFSYMALISTLLLSFVLFFLRGKTFNKRTYRSLFT